METQLLECGRFDPPAQRSATHWGCWAPLTDWRCGGASARAVGSPIPEHREAFLGRSARGGCQPLAPGGAAGGQSPPRAHPALATLPIPSHLFLITLFYYFFCLVCSTSSCYLLLTFKNLCSSFPFTMEIISSFHQAHLFSFLYNLLFDFQESSY